MWGECEGWSVPVRECECVWAWLSVWLCASLFAYLRVIERLRKKEFREDVFTVTREFLFFVIKLVSTITTKNAMKGLV